jgi:hypothetical protein
MAKIYVASSWRNKYQENVVKLLRENGHEVYDFKNPNPEDPNNNGFRWSAIDPDWLNWTPERFKEVLNHPIAIRGYKSDKDAIDWCDMGILVLPCGRSAHLEAGWIGGSKKRVAVYMPELPEPELMYRFFIEQAQSMGIQFDAICLTEQAMLEFAASKPYPHIYSHESCTFHYCPNPDTCKPINGCIVSGQKDSK